MNDWPVCGAPLKKGRCKSAVVAGPDGEPGDRCAFHSTSLEPVALAEHASSVSAPGSTDADETVTVERIDSLRAALREGSSTSEVAELMRAMILDGLRASRDVFHTCSKCGKRDPVSLPDLNTRIGAARALVEELEGKQQQPTARPFDEIARRAERNIESLTDDELVMLTLDGNGELPDMHEEAAVVARRVLAGVDGG